MDSLEDRLLRDLARLRQREGPPRGAEDRVLAALQTATGGDPSGGDGESGLGDPGLGSLAFGAKVLAATTAFTSAGLLVIKLGVMVIHPSPDPHQPAVEAVIQAVANEERSASEPTIAADPPILVTPRAFERKPAKMDEDPLTAELALLEQARATDDLAVRLDLLERHRDRFASGVMTAERDALRVSTLCELDQMEAAREAAEQFLIDHPHSPLRLRMRGACPRLDVLAD